MRMNWTRTLSTAVVALFDLALYFAMTRWMGIGQVDTMMIIVAVDFAAIQVRQK